MSDWDDESEPLWYGEDEDETFDRLERRLLLITGIIVVLILAAMGISLWLM